MPETLSLLDRVARQLYAALHPPSPLVVALVVRAPAPAPHQHAWGLTGGRLACVGCLLPFHLVRKAMKIRETTDGEPRTISL